MNAFTRNVARLRQFTARTSLIGIPTRRVLLWELPRFVAWRAYARLASVLYTFVDWHRLVDERTRKSLRPLTEGSGIYFYVIVVPRMLHFLVPAVRLVRNHVKVVFVLNGISPAEEKALRREFPEMPALRVWTFPLSIWPHGRVMSLLLRISERDFGILDHDFFLFDPSVFNQLIFREDEYAICATTWRNGLTGREFPGTHFLYLRVAMLRGLMERYGVGAQLYKRIPRNVRWIVERLGLSLDNPPKDYQTFFDSFLLLSALAMYEGWKVRTVDVAAGDWQHVGGTSIGLAVTKDALHHYICIRFLEMLSNTGIAGEYGRSCLATPEQAEALRQSLNPEIAARADALIARVASVMAHEWS